MKYFNLIIVLLLSAASSRAQSINVDSLKSKDNLLLYNGKAYTGIYFKNLHACQKLFVFQTSEIKNGLYNGKTIFKNSMGEVIGNGVYENGIKVGLWIEIEAHTNECSEPIYYVHRGKYINGKREGKWHEGGSYGNYKNGQKEGKWITCYSDEKRSNVKILEGNYVAGKKKGKWKSWHTNGKLSGIKHYLNDSLDGKYISFFWDVIKLNDHKVIGFKKGHKEEVGQYYKNKKVGQWKEYFSDSNTAEWAGEYKNDKKDGIWVFSSEGRIHQKDFYENGKLVKTIVLSYRLKDKIEEIITLYK